MPRFCEYCRSELPFDAAYCPHCGAEPPVTPVTPPAPATPVTQPGTPVTPAQSAAKSDSQALSITAFVLSLAGLLIIITFIPGFIIGLIALKREPRGKVFAWIAVGLSGGVLLIGVVLIITSLIQALGAPQPWY